MAALVDGGTVDCVRFGFFHEGTGFILIEPQSLFEPQSLI